MKNNSNQPIFVTQPALPPLKEFTKLLEKIWDNKVLTNNGPFHQELEEKLAKYLGVKYLSLFSNGTLALMTALQTLNITGEVITTPYSFVATTHALWWNNIKPVFVDIEPNYFNLDPDKIESAITPNTTAIMPVHVYGNPCNVNKIKKIADTYGLKVIYDSAHAFGVKLKNKSILNFGDLSILSFHAVKVFNTIEGGAIVCHDKKTKNRIDYLKNFGFTSEVTVVAPGINAKMNELQSAYGLLQLKYVDGYIKKRKKVTEVYRQALDGVPGIHFLEDMPNVTHNYSYFPVLIDKKKYGKSRDEVYELLKKHNIFGRRYFYPLISQFPTYKNLSSADKTNLTVSHKITQQVLCLPISPALSKIDQVKILKLLIDKKI